MTERKAKPKAKGASPAGKTKSPAKASQKSTLSPADWRARAMADVRRIIQEADAEIVEERKWIKPTNPAGVPTWSHAGIVCTGETYKEVVKLTFARGASLKDPRGLFNSSLEGNTRRAIDIREGDAIDAKALTALIRAAVAENLRFSAAKAKPAPKTSAKAKASASQHKPVKLLSGGNPQIAKGDGDAPVQAYIAAVPALWKRDLCKRLDGLIVRHVPNVRKAVKWNSPFYGVEGRGWFFTFHVFTRYVKVTFFNGTSLKPVPPGGTHKDARWFDLHEDDQFDEAQLTAWIKQSAALPGWSP